MTEVREYSSLFASKLVYVLENIDALCESGVINAISEITQEKDSTTKNWLFNGKIPRKPKRLQIADALGISEDYLFDDDIDIEDIQKPHVVMSEGCYLIPFHDESQIFTAKKAAILPVSKRIPLMFPELDRSIEKYGKGVFATSLKNTDFAPHIDKGATLICSHYGRKLDEYNFVITNDNTPRIKRVISVGGTYQLLSYTADKEELLENPKEHKNIILILFAFSPKV